jgi:hypothetical protein
MADDDTRQNLAIAPLPGRQEEAARLVAEDSLTNEEIAAAVGVKRQTVDWWKTKPHFAARVQEHKETFKNRALSEGFADKRERLRVLNMLGVGVLGELAKEGGFYREEVKIAANGEHVAYQVFDKPKHDTLRGYLDDIAQEMGERKTGLELSGDEANPLVLGLLNVELGKV